MVEKNYNFYRIFKNSYCSLDKSLNNNYLFLKFNYLGFGGIFIKDKKSYKNTFFLKKIILKEFFFLATYNYIFFDKFFFCTKLLNKNSNLKNVVIYIK